MTDKTAASKIEKPDDAKEEKHDSKNKPWAAERVSVKREVSTTNAANTGTSNTSSELSIPLPQAKQPEVMPQSIPSSSGSAPPSLSSSDLLAALARHPEILQAIQKGSLQISPIAEHETTADVAVAGDVIASEGFGELVQISKPYCPPPHLTLSIGRLSGDKDYLNLDVYGTPIESVASDTIKFKEELRPVLYYAKDATCGTSLPFVSASLAYSPERNFLEAIVTTTQEMFNEQGGYIRLAISDEVWEKSGCVSVCGVPLYNSQHTVTVIASVHSFIPRSQYVNGAIRLALTIMTEFSVIFINTQENVVIDGSSLSNFPQFSNICLSTRRQVITPVYPNPIMLHKITHNLRLSQNLQELAGLNIYKLGFGDRIDIIDGIGISDVYYANIDFMAAELIRITNEEYDNTTLPIEILREAILAFAAPGTSLNIDRVSYQRSKKITLRPPQDALGRIVFVLCAVPEFKPQIVAMYQNFIAESGIVKMTIDSTVQFGVENNPSGTNLMNILAGKMSQFRHDNMYSVLTYEILPDFYYLVTEPIPKPMDVTNMCVTLFEIMMFFILFPRAAYQIGYSLANTLANLFRSMFPRRFNDFTTTVGWIHGRAGDPAYHISDNDYLIGNIKPSIFFGAEACGNDQLFHRLATYITPVGYLLPHSHALEAGFPRLRTRPTTYIPYPRTGDRPYEPTALSQRIVLIIDYITMVLTEYSREGASRNVSTSDISVIKTWLQTANLHVDAFAGGMCAVGRVMAVTTNFYFTFKTDYSGNLYDPIPPDLAVVETRPQMSPRVMRMSDPNSDRVTISTSIVFGLFYHAEFLGFQPTLGDTHFSDVIKCTLADPLSLLTTSLSIYRQMELVALPFGVMVTLLDPACDTPGLRRLRDVLNTGWNDDAHRRPLFTPAEGIAFLVAISDLLCDAKTYRLGRALDASGGDAKRNMIFFQPGIRLFSHSMDVLPVNNDSPPVIRQMVSLLSAFDYRRILLCLDFVCDGTSPANKLVKGLVLKKTSTNILNPNELADLEGFDEVEYSNDLFINERRFDRNALGLTFNGRNYFEPDTFPLLVVNIPNLSDLSEQNLILLSLGVSERRIALRFPNALFAYTIKTASMTECISELANFDVSSFVHSLSASIVALTFHDTRPANEYRYHSPSVFSTYRFIFPIDPLPTHDLIAAGIVPEASQDRGFYPIAEQVVDTGRLGNGIIGSNNRPKTYRSKSYTNPVKAYRKNAELTRPPRVEIKSPAVLSDPR